MLDFKRTATRSFPQQLPPANGEFRAKRLKLLTPENAAYLENLISKVSTSP